jgi:hypothetical protein
MNDVTRVLSVAQQITKRSAVTLAPLEREMDLMKWASEFRMIMWEAVANDALARARVLLDSASDGQGVGDKT